ncbi:MAG: 50S ribosomal protein L35 [Gammaproteobacteria bacterium]
MPKLKTNKSASKRFKKTGSGGFKHRQGYRAHILTKKSTKRKRHLRGMKMVNDSDIGAIKQMMPYSN